MSSKYEQNERLLLENSLNDIRYTKKQQWYVLYLTLFAIAGITSLALQFIACPPIPCRCFGILLMLGNTIIGAIGIGFLFRYADDLKRYRKEKLDHMVNLEMKKDKDTGDIYFFTVCFSGIIVLSFVISLWVIKQLY